MAGINVNCGEDAAGSFGVLASGFPVSAGAVSVSASNVVKGSRRVLESGFPRRSLGRFGSSIVSSDAAAFAGSAAAGAFALSVGLGAGGALAAVVVEGAGAVAGFSWFLFLSLSLSWSLSLSLFLSWLSAPLSESVLPWRCSTGGASLSSITGVEYFLLFSEAFAPAGSHDPSAIQRWFSCPGCVMVNTPCDTPVRKPS